MSDTKTETQIRNPYGYHHEAFIDQVFGPFIEKILEDINHEAESLAQIHRLYREQSGSNISMATFKTWMADYGIVFERIVQMSRPETAADAENSIE